MPIQTQYAIHSGANRIQENVSDFRRGIVEEQATRKQGRAVRQNQHRQTIAEKRKELDRARQSSGSTGKGAAPTHDRPATTPVSVKSGSQAAANRQKESMARERPAMAEKGQAASSRTRDAALRQQENTRGNQPVSAALSRQTTKQKKQVAIAPNQTVRQSLKADNSHQTASRKGRKK